jgi:exodeoxyribonuclease VII small subunit
MTQKKQSNLKKLNFEEAYAQLEETVQTLESGNLPLAEALTLYERGMALAKHCHGHLDQAELSIKKLADSGDLVDFDES